MTQTPTQKNTQPMRYELLNRYVFDGNLEMQTALHIGGGKATLSPSDSPVVLTADGLPFIPGSSLKGTLRSLVEKFAASLPPDLGLHSCGLPLEEVPGESCPTARPKEIATRRRNNPNNLQFMEDERKKLCQTCQLFGSPFAAARITVQDLYLINEEWSGAVQIRDGVAIDRDSETAKNGLKYDFEVIPSTTVFKLRIIIENATEQDLQLISIGLSEFVSGFGSIGGFRSRGLGVCILNDLTIRAMELKNLDGTASRQRLQRYLRRNLFKPKDGAAKIEDGLDAIEPQTFFEQHMKALFKETAANAQ